MKKIGGSSFIKGALILGIAELIVKIMGAIYRIPLTRLIGDAGMGYYSSGFMIYTWLFTLSTTGIPVAISKLVSEKRALKNEREAHRIFEVAMILLFFVGIGCSLIFYLGAQRFSNMIHNPSAAIIMVALSPTLFFVCVTSGFRGYFQGQENMVPTAISKIVEQGGKAVIGLLLAFYFVTRGKLYGAYGATLGTTIGAFLGMLTLGIYYTIWKWSQRGIEKVQTKINKENGMSIMMKLIKISIPISIGASVYTAANLVDLTLIQGRLRLAGFSSHEANILFGQYAGKTNTLINFPTVLTLSLAASLVPAIASAMAQKKRKELEQKIFQAFRITILFIFPAAIGMSILAEPILMFLFSKELKGGAILQIGAFAMIFLALVQVMTAILQGVGKVVVPALALLVGAIIKIFVNYFLIAMPSVNIRGAVVGTILCYSVAAIIDYYVLSRSVGYRFPLKELLLKPLAAAMVMGVGAKLVYEYIYQIMAGEWSHYNWHFVLQQEMDGKIPVGVFRILEQANRGALLSSMAFAVLLYGMILLFSKQLYYEDFSTVPRLRGLGEFLKKMKIISSMSDFPK